MYLLEIRVTGYMHTFRTAATKTKISSLDKLAKNGMDS
jgi:hypothetical protein